MRQVNKMGHRAIVGAGFTPARFTGAFTKHITILLLVVLLIGTMPCIASAATTEETLATTDKQTFAPVLSSDQFIGNVAMGYAAAKAVPHICNKLFCYCGCDLTDRHGSLLDCFTSRHGVDCHICQEEALLAFKLNRQDATLADIQKAVDEQYGTLYPFHEASPALKHYQANRLWNPIASNSAAESKDLSVKPDTDKGAGCCGPGTK